MKYMKKFVEVLCCKILFRVKYINIENIKQIDRCVICPNHSCIFDPTFIFPIVDNLYIMAKSELFRNRVISNLFRKYNVFPIDRNRVDAQSLMHSLDIFKDTGEKRLLIFTEGKVVKNAEDIGKSVKKGAVYIAANSGVPIIPVYITRRPKLFSRVEVIFGKPIHIAREEVDNKEKIIELSRELIKKIYDLGKYKQMEHYS